MKTTTLNEIRKHSPCASGWKKLLAHLSKIQADDEPLNFLTILESNGLNDAIWCARSTPEYDKDWRLLAVKYARSIQHLMTDTRSINAIDVAERFANGKATREELEAAKDAAEAVASNTAWAAAKDAAWDTTRDAIGEAVMAVAWAAAMGGVERTEQTAEFIRMVSE